ncbi:MAG: GNAT family N-acetyltransferase [Roseivirga sp.]|nr:GNAT family N-acetyltransferase [Roseivirga sp.]
MRNEVKIDQITAPQTLPLRHAVMWPDKPLDYIKLPNDHQGLHYGLFVKQQLVSVISLFVNGHEAQFRKFATLTAEQGKGYGTQLLSHLFEQVETKGVQRLWCNARIDKAAYYERFAMKKTRQTFIKGGIDYVIMEYVFKSP